MKDNLFEMLLNLFEKSLSQLQKSHQNKDQDPLSMINDEDLINEEEHTLFIKSAQSESTRIFTYEEQMKLTKASHQFLMRMKLWNMLDDELFELIMNQLLLSESRIITLQETKWTIRNVLSANLNEEQLAFLDLVLFQTEDNLTVH